MTVNDTVIFIININWWNLSIL